MSTGERRYGFWRRIAYGPARQPLEPHRPVPWLFRGVSWLLLAVGLVVMAPVPVLLAFDREPLAGTLASLATIPLSLGVCVRTMAASARPAPLVLMRADEDE